MARVDSAPSLPQPARRVLAGGIAYALACAVACTSTTPDPDPPAASPPSIVLYYDASTGAGWEVAALLATGPYDYPTPEGLLRDAVERYLQDGIARMTGTAPPIRNSDDLEAEPAGSILIVRYPDAPAALRDDPAIQEALGRTSGAEPDYVRDRESFYLRTRDERTWVIANTEDGIAAALPALLESVGYDVLGIGPNWMYAPDFHERPLSFAVERAGRNDGYGMRLVGGWGASGLGSLVIEFPLAPPDEDVTKSYARWRIGTRMNAGSAVPAYTGDAMDSYADAVLAYMRANRLDDGFITRDTRYGLDAERPPAGPDTDRWLWLNTDDERAFYCDGAVWNEVRSQGVGFNIDVSTDWARGIVLDIMKAQANAQAWARPDDWAVFAAQPEDGGGFTHFAEEVRYPTWYEDYRAAEGQAWGPYVLDGSSGIAQPLERYDSTAVSDTVYGFGNWLLREYDRWVDSLPEGPQTDPEQPTRQTRSGRDRKALLRVGISSYNFNDVPPHFNLDPRIRVIIAGYSKNRGNAEWPMILSRVETAAAMQRMLPGEPIANYATIDDWGWDPEQMSYVLPHLWGNSSQSILSLFQPFTDVGVRGWQAEMEMGYTQHSLGLYLMGHYMRDPSLDEAALDALRDRWLARAFGPGAAAMRAYFDATEPGQVPDVASQWGRAIDLVNIADQAIAAGTPEQRRLDDVKQHLYFYYFMDTGQLTADNPAARELMWKGQSAFTVCNYLLSYWVFGGPWVADMPELRSPVDYTAGPAHYSEAEVASWWSEVDAHWDAEDVLLWEDVVLRDGTRAPDVDRFDLVSVAELQGYEQEWSEVLSYSLWDIPYTELLLVAGPGEDVGFQMLWPAYDPPNAQEYFGPHETTYTIDRWEHGWHEVATGRQASQRLAPEATYLGTDAWHVRVAYPAPERGTYRVTVGYGGVGSLASLAWDITSPPAPLADANGPTYAQMLHLDAQPEDGGLYLYVPKGVASLDFEMLDRDEDYPKTLTLYRGLPLAADTPARTVDITTTGTHRVVLESGEDGSVARFQLGVQVFQVPFVYSVPLLWARSPSALLVPRAIAAADGLTPR